MMQKALLSAFLVASAVPASAQYIVHSWESFEAGVPTNMKLGHHADAQSLSTLTYSMPGAPANLNTGMAQLHCGRSGLVFTTRKDHKHLSVVTPLSLNRDRLGSAGRALYQFDFYYPGPNAGMPNVAVLAVSTDHNTAGNSYVMYRFGIGEKGQKTYFSYSDDDKNATPKLYLNKPLKAGELTVGWHRLQLIFEGKDKIHCAIDAKPVSYSPITEGSLRNLTPGIMIAATPDTPRSILADNLSIQWTAEDTPIPDSPWVAASSEAAITADSYFSVHPGVTWLEDPQQAWQVCAQQKRPILAMFYSPKVGPYKYLLSIVQNNEATRDLLSKYVLLKVDANQLNGGALAARFKVTRLPTFVVLNSTGQEQRRFSVAPGSTKWDEVAGFLAAQ